MIIIIQNDIEIGETTKYGKCIIYQHTYIEMSVVKVPIEAMRIDRVLSGRRIENIVPCVCAKTKLSET